MLCGPTQRQIEQKCVLTTDIMRRDLCCLLGIKSSPSPTLGSPELSISNSSISRLEHHQSTKVKYRIKLHKRTKYSSIFTMPHHHLPACHAECGNDKNDHKTVSIVPPTAPANAPTDKSSAAVKNTLYNVWCCRCGRLLNLQNVHYVHTCLCRHRRCDRCRMTPI